MKSTSYSLVTPLEQAELEKRIEQLDVEKLDPELRSDAMLHAGLDRYVSGIGFFRLTGPWRGHAVNSLVVRHINSSGLQVTVCASEPETPAPASSADDKSDPKAVAAVLELEQKRQAQQEKDAAEAAAKKAANENQEQPAAPAPAATNS